MLHSDALRLLTPLEVGGVDAIDRAVKGAQLDLAAAGSDTMLAEAFPATAYITLEQWERAYALFPAVDDPLQVRQNRIIAKMREIGRLDRQYFIDLAAAMGYPIVIDELCPFMAGWGCAGDELGDDDSDWCWRVWYSESAAGYYFRAGESAAGECLSYTYFTALQALFEELKPADTFIEFSEAV